MLQFTSTYEFLSFTLVPQPEDPRPDVLYLNPRRIMLHVRGFIWAMAASAVEELWRHVCPLSSLPPPSSCSLTLEAGKEASAARTGAGADPGFRSSPSASPSPRISRPLLGVERSYRIVGIAMVAEQRI
jgi:hypothetical protein